MNYLYTEEQKAHHLRKMKSCFERLDFDEDGYLSRRDFELMSRKLAEYSEMTELEQTESLYEEFMKVADLLNLKPGVKMPVEEAAQQTSEVILSMTHDKQSMLIHNYYEYMFNLIDTDKDGRISLDKFKVYFYVIAPELAEAERVGSFNAIDADKDGEICRDEFLTAVKEFVTGVEETEISNALFGRLLC